MGDLSLYHLQTIHIQKISQNLGRFLSWINPYWKFIKAE